MIEFVKRAVSQVIYKTNKELYNGVVCSILSIIQEDVPIIRAELEIFDFVSLAKIFNSKFAAESERKDQELSELTPLDYAELYEHFGGNSIIFLRNYQNYIGPIE